MHPKIYAYTRVYMEMVGTFSTLFELPCSVIADSYSRYRLQGAVASYIHTFTHGCYQEQVATDGFH